MNIRQSRGLTGSGTPPAKIDGLKTPIAAAAAATLSHPATGPEHAG